MSSSDRLALALDSGEMTLPQQGNVAVFRADLSDFLRAVPREQLACEQSFRPAHDRLLAAGLPVTPALALAEAAMVVVNLTRSKEEGRGEIARALSLLAPGGTLVLNGSKTDGIESLVREIRSVIPATGAFAKAHGKVVTFSRPEVLPELVGSWQAEARAAANRDGILSGPGMFSARKVDAGSRLLAGWISAELKGRVADLGAGWGFLSATCLDACPGVTAIDLHEAEKRALDTAKANIADPRASFCWTDVTLLGRDTAPYDLVVTNPPFHAGRETRPEIGAGFIAAAGRILKPGGRLLLVANRHLPYEAQMDASFQRWERLTENRDYKVFSATRPRRA
jgi:16S rRNA (guanine1207-N2)-methyltransferase